MNNNNNNIIQNLIRASLGREANSVNDDQLETYVTELIAKEAAEKHMKSLLQDPAPPLKRTHPRPNTRYLRNVLKQTHSHNSARCLHSTPPPPQRPSSSKSNTMNPTRRQRNKNRQMYIDILASGNTDPPLPPQPQNQIRNQIVKSPIPSSSRLHSHDPPSSLTTRQLKKK